MIATTYTVCTPCGSFLAEWDEDEDIPVRYSGNDEAMDFFRSYMALNLVSGRCGIRLQPESLGPADLYGFCQSEKYGIVVLPPFEDLLHIQEEGREEDEYYKGRLQQAKALLVDLASVRS